MKKEDLKIVFFGTPEFAVESLKALVDNGFNVIGVVTMPDKPAGRGHKILHSPVKDFALANDLYLMQPVNLKDQSFVRELEALNAGLFIVIAFRMLPEIVWQMPPLGTFNLHASLLPRYRGAAPINRAVMNGDTITGVTTFMLKHEIDTGDILQQESVEILPTENVGDVHDKLMHLGARLTVETVNHIIKGDLRPIPQSELTSKYEPSPAPKIFSDDCVIDWTKSAVDIHNFVRGLSPYPSARSSLSYPKENLETQAVIQFKIFSTRICDFPKDKSFPGQIEICDNKRMIVAAGDGKGIEILELQPSGKKRMTTDAFLRGQKDFSSHFVSF